MMKTDKPTGKTKRHMLKEVRESQHLTQKQLWQALGISQKRISILESGDVEHCKIGTLRRYLEGAGGSLCVKVVLPDGEELQLV